MELAILCKKSNKKGGPLGVLEISSNDMLSGYLSPELHARLKSAGLYGRKKRKSHHE